MIAFARALNRAKLEDAYALMSNDYKQAGQPSSSSSSQLEGTRRRRSRSATRSATCASPAEQRAVVYDDDRELELTPRGRAAG